MILKFVFRLAMQNTRSVLFNCPINPYMKPTALADLTGSLSIEHFLCGSKFDGSAVCLSIFFKIHDNITSFRNVGVKMVSAHIKVAK